jgi:hypothetical protein
VFLFSLENNKAKAADCTGVDAAGGSRGHGYDLLLEGDAAETGPRGDRAGPRSHQNGSASRAPHDGCRRNGDDRGYRDDRREGSDRSRDEDKRTDEQSSRDRDRDRDRHRVGDRERGAHRERQEGDREHGSRHGGEERKHKEKKHKSDRHKERRGERGDDKDHKRRRHD